MSVLKINKEQFEKEVLQSDKPVLVDFNADWCGPCRMLAPVLEALAEKHPEAKIVSVNVDDNPSLAADYFISSIPCVVLIKHGEEADRSVGLVPAERLEALLRG